MRIRITSEDELSKAWYGLHIGAEFEVLAVVIRTGNWSYRIETIDNGEHNFKGRLRKIWVREDECEQINVGKPLKELI